MEVATTIDELVLLARNVKSAAGCVVGIDGFDGTGKTTLAFELARKLDGFRVGLDNYIAKDEPAEDYVGLLRADHLKRDLTVVASRFPFAVVDGVCLLHALERIGVSPSLTVYVKKFSPQGLWHDGFHLEDYIGGKPAESWLDKSVYGYHAAYRPHEQAEVYFHWVRA